MTFPIDVIDAVTAPDPSPYYAHLAATAPMAFDDRLSAWVATGPAVAAVLSSERCAVRPPGAPVPPGLVGSSAAELYARLARTTDGARHRVLRAATAGHLDRCEPARVAGVAAVEAARLIAERPVAADAAAVDRFVSLLPARAVASSLGLDGVDDIRRFAACLAPGADLDDPGLHAASDRLLAQVGSDDVRLGAVGLVCQASVATAALIGNALVALGRGSVAAEVGPLVADVMRRDPPVHNTRRFVTGDGPVAGRDVRAGDTIIVVLASAPSPFGAGAHVCPGQAIANAIAEVALGALLAAGVEPARLIAGLHYLPSQSARRPLFAAAEVGS